VESILLLLGWPQIEISLIKPGKLTQLFTKVGFSYMTAVVPLADFNIVTVTLLPQEHRKW